MEHEKTGGALVTGGSRGIGLAIARQLARDGWRVAVLSTGPKEKYPAAVAALEADGADYCWLSGDLGDSADRARLAEEAVAALGEVRVLVNNAGVAPKSRTDLLDMTEESYDRVMGVNTKGTLFFTQAIARHMLTLPAEGRAKRATIVNVSSCSAEAVSLNRGEYCISKAGVSMLTRLFAARLAPAGILVHEVRPGVIATDMTTAVQEKYDRLIADGAFPIARWGTPQDVADAVSLLCSDKLRYTTGNYLDVDGGFHIPML